MRQTPQMTMKSMAPMKIAKITQRTKMVMMRRPMNAMIKMMMMVKQKSKPPHKCVYLSRLNNNTHRKIHTEQNDREFSIRKTIFRRIKIVYLLPRSFISFEPPLCPLAPLSTPLHPFDVLKNKMNCRLRHPPPTN